MCGIAGVVDHQRRLGTTQLIAVASSMADRLSHRGPDDRGVWVDPLGMCALSHRRLAVIELGPSGRQPMISDDGSAAITFNGEVYNYVQLRRRLRERGALFVTNGDTEVLFQTMLSDGPNGLKLVDGMYAFGLWDSRQQRLILARDAHGKKPLYLAHVDGLVAFASELNAFDALPGFAAKPTPTAIAEYLLLKHIRAPRTIFSQCSKVPPGTWQSIHFGTGTPHVLHGKHFEFRVVPPAPNSPSDLGEAADGLLALLAEATSARLQSDVPVGAFLSGGIDSALIAAVVRRELGQPLATFTLRFAGAETSEHEPARYVAKVLDTQHRECEASPDHVGLLPMIAAALDEPNADTSCLPTYLLSQYMRQYVTVSLSGDGGDELFGGYSRYATLSSVNPRARGSDDDHLAAEYVLRHCVIPPAAVAALLPACRGDIAALIADLTTLFSSSDASALDCARHFDAVVGMPCWLAKVDRMSMRFALEVRAPFLSRSIAEFAQCLPPGHCVQGGTMKVLLRHLARRYFSDAYIHRPKQGFGIPAEPSWSRQTLVNICKRELLPSSSRLHSVLNPDALCSLVSNDRLTISAAWSLLVLEYWLRARGRGPTTHNVATRGGSAAAAIGPGPQ
jgi:asparagine synthase (glutamine-hydrolysing)